MICFSNGEDGGASIQGGGCRPDHCSGVFMCVCLGTLNILHVNINYIIYIQTTITALINCYNTLCKFVSIYKTVQVMCTEQLTHQFSYVVDCSVVFLT